MGSWKQSGKPQDKGVSDRELFCYLLTSGSEPEKSRTLEAGGASEH